VLLEGDSSSVEIHVKPSDFTSQRPNLNDFKQILKQQFEALKDVRPGNIDFISYKDRTQALFGDVLLANFHTTASCPLVVRYPLSTSSINYQNSSIAKVDDLYFELFEGNHEENLDIKNEFQFNKLVNQIEEKKETRVLPDLKVQIKDKKPYNEWDIRDVFTNVLHQEFNGSFDQAFNLDELPKHTSITEKEMEFFIEDIKRTLKAFKNNISVNEATAAINYIQTLTNNSAQLYVEANLYGSKGYGPVDYLVKLDDFAVLVNKAKLEDIHKGIAQNIMQLHSASERKLEQTEFESSQQQLFGIVTTGVCWFFIRWTGSPENPKLKSLNNIIVILQGRWRVKKKYIVRILENQNDMLKNNSKRA
ncbi:5412_t:CDS:2, partial [Gigaspora rosea]